MIRIKELLTIILLLPVMACDPIGMDNEDSSLDPGKLNPGLSAYQKLTDIKAFRETENYVQNFYLFNEVTTNAQKLLCEKKSESGDESELCRSLPFIYDLVGKEAIIVRPRPRHCPQVGKERFVFDETRGVRVPGTICETRFCTSLSSGCLDLAQDFNFVVNAVSPEYVTATLKMEGELIAGIGEGFEGSVLFDEENSKAYLDFGMPTNELVEEGMVLSVNTVVEIEGEYVETNINIIL